MTVLCAVTGVTFVTKGLRGLAKLTLGLKRSAELQITERGLEIKLRTELLGRVLGDHLVLVPVSNLERVRREVRYARAGLYAGLIALVVGTYLGVGLIIDGARVAGGSASLIGLGLGIVAIGLVLDFLLTSALDSAAGRCSILISLRKGAPVLVSAIDRADADAFLRRLATLDAFQLAHESVAEAMGTSGAAGAAP